MKLTALGNYCDITSAKRIYAEEYVEEGIPFYRGKEIIEKSKDQTISEPLFISEDRFNELTTKFGAPKAGDILLTSVGTLGIPYVVQEKDKFYFKDGNLTWLRKFSNELNSKYLYYWLTSDFGKEPLLARAIGSSQGAITIEILKKYKIHVPDREVQDNIVEVLSRYDNSIRLNNNRIKLLEQTAQEIYKEWFVRFRFPGYEKAEFERAVPKGWVFGEEENSKIPNKWHYGELRELGEFVRGKNITADNMVEGDIPVISAGIEPSGYHNQANVNGYSITMSASGANAGYLKYNLEDIWCADCSYYQNEENIWYVYNSLKFIESVINNLQVGSAQPHVYPKHSNRLSIPIPSKDLIKEFNTLCVPIYEEIKTLQRINQNTIQQRDYLLPRLMSGKLEV